MAKAMRCCSESYGARRIGTPSGHIGKPTHSVAESPSLTALEPRGSPDLANGGLIIAAHPDWLTRVVDPRDLVRPSGSVKIGIIADGVK